MKFKLSSFTLFVLLLIVLVLFIILGKTTKFFYKKEPFVNFQNNQPSTYGSLIYIPQYSSDKTRKVTSLYDNLYFDQLNGNIIEVNSSGCQKDAKAADCNDKVGTSISEIFVIPRGGESVVIYPSQPISSDGMVPSYSTKESLLNTISPSYKQFSYRTKCETTDKYQLFYISWNLDTYIYLVNISGASNGKSVKLFYFNKDGLVQSPSLGDDLPAFLKDSDYLSINDPKDNTSYNDANYLGGTVSVHQLAQNILYDSKNGNVIVKNIDTNKKETTYNVYNRSGSGSIATPKDNTSIQNIVDKLNFFSVKDSIGGMIIVIAYKTNTTISRIIPRKKQNAYIIERTVRFTPSGVVTNLSNDTSAGTSAGTSVGTSAGTSGKSGTSAGTSCNAQPQVTSSSTLKPELPDWKRNYDINTPELNKKCGDDMSCKWYWYFKTISDIDKVNDYFSDDYFLKTEVVPPVCPRCPNCPSSGACVTCGGTGGAGATVGAPTTAAPTSAAPTAAPTSAVPTSAVPTASVAATTTAPTTATAVPNATSTSIPSSQNSIGGVSNNLVDSAENLAYKAGSGATNLLKETGSGAAGLLKDTTTGAVGLLKDTTTGAVGLLKETGSGAVGLLKDFGSGVYNLGQPYKGVQGAQGVQTSGQQWGQQGLQQTGVQQGLQQVGQQGGIQGLQGVSDRNFGSMNVGQTPVDSYSYYGALQTKGGNYMPVTADFSSFRK